MSEHDDNPFASPPVEPQDPADAPLMDGDKIGRWLLLPLVSGVFNGAGIVSILGMAIVMGLQAMSGALSVMLSYPDGRMILGVQLLMLAIYGGVCGGLSGIVYGGLAFRQRRNLGRRSLFFLFGYLLASLILVGPAVAGMLLVGQASVLFLCVSGAFLMTCSLLFAWRMNHNIRKYLLSRAADESEETR